MHKVHYFKKNSFTYKKLTEYQNLYTFTLTFKKTDINHLEAFKKQIHIFELFKIDAFFKYALCINDKEGSFHTYKKLKDSHHYHFHGIIASKEEINLMQLHSKIKHQDFYIQPILDNKYYENFMNYVNEYHNISSIFSGYSF